VCMNGGNPREDLIAHKDPEKAMALEHDPAWEALSLKSHGRTYGRVFFYGDCGGDELDASGRPRVLQHKAYFDPSQEPFHDMRESHAPLVWQCRYGGVEVPDQLWSYCEFGKDTKYSDNQAEDMIRNIDVLQTFDGWTDEFAGFVQGKGKVHPGKYRAYGYDAPRHLLRDAQLLWRDVRMRAGVPPKDLSRAQQQELGLNRDKTWSPHESEGEKLRRKK